MAIIKTTTQTISEDKWSVLTFVIFVVGTTIIIIIRWKSMRFEMYHYIFFEARKNESKQTYNILLLWRLITQLIHIHSEQAHTCVYRNWEQMALFTIETQMKCLFVHSTHTHTHKIQNKTTKFAKAIFYHHNVVIFFSFFFSSCVWYKKMCQNVHDQFLGNVFHHK